MNGEVGLMRFYWFVGFGVYVFRLFGYRFILRVGNILVYFDRIFVLGFLSRVLLSKFLK